LGKLISEYIGYSQISSFETYERVTCHKAGKSHREYGADYYAMGATLCSVLIGGTIFQAIPSAIVAKIKFENGSFDSFYYLANTKASLNISSRNESLITVIAENWDTAKKAIKLSDMARWLSFTSKFTDIESKLFGMTKPGQLEVIIPDEKLSRLLYYMDDSGPFRYRKLTFHPDGLGNLLSYLNQNPDEELTSYLLKALDYGLIEGWIMSQDDRNMYKLKRLGWSPRKIKFFARKKEIGFGIERVMYETSKFLPCQGEVLKDRYCVGLPSLLTSLNDKRLSYGEESNVDNHITSYITTYIELEDSVKIKQLKSFPQIAKSAEIKHLAIFTLAQQKSGIKSLPALSQWLREGLNLISKNLNSKNIKSTLAEKLDEAVPSGDLQKLFSIIVNANLIRNDLYGFKEAKTQYKILNFEILKLRSQANLDQLSYRLGLRVSVIFSYLICVISILSIMIFTS